MEYIILLLLLLSIFSFSSPKSQGYSKHLRLSLIFYEFQRSGILSPDNRTYFRYDNMLDAGNDVNVDFEDIII